ALERGAHVLVEKPIAARPQEYEHMRALALERDRLLVESYNYRFTPAVGGALDLLASGAIGELVGLELAFTGVMGDGYADRDVPHFAHSLPGGALQNFVTHPVSLALAFLGQCTEVQRVVRRHDPAFASDDELRALLRGPRACATLAVSRHAR